MGKGRKVAENERALRRGEQFNLGDGKDEQQKFEFGFGWNPGCDSPDLDVSVSAFDSNGTPLGICAFFDKTGLAEYGVTTSGDNMTGEGDGDDETIYVDLGKLATLDVSSLVFSISAYSSFFNTFLCITGKRIRLYGPQYGEPMQLGHFNMGLTGCANHVIAGVIHRKKDGTFEFHGLGDSVTKCNSDGPNNTASAIRTELKKAAKEVGAPEPVEPIEMSARA